MQLFYYMYIYTHFSDNSQDRGKACERVGLGKGSEMYMYSYLILYHTCEFNIHSARILVHPAGIYVMYSETLICNSCKPYQFGGAPLLLPRPLFSL